MSYRRLPSNASDQPARPLVIRPNGRAPDRDASVLSIAANQPASTAKVAAVPQTTPYSKHDLRRLHLLEAFSTEIQLFRDAIKRRLSVSAPNFDLRLLSGKDHHNRELFNLFSGLLLYLYDGRKVSVDAIARVVAVLFFTTLLSRHGIAPAGLEVSALNQASGRERRRCFMLLWVWLYCRTMPSRNTNSAPTWRASYEVAKKLLPGAARDWDSDRDARKLFMRRLRQKLPSEPPP